MVFENLKPLRNEMLTNEIAVTVFRFEYKQLHYFISVCLLTEEDRKKKTSRICIS